MEGNWIGIKMNISPSLRTRNKIGIKITEFARRRKNNKDLWNGFVNAMKIVDL